MKQIITNNADVIPDYEGKTLTVVLYSHPASKVNNAVAKLAETINHNKPSFPGVDLTLISKISRFANCKR